MAGEAVVGALRVILGMDTAQFEDGTKRAVKELTGLSSSFKKIAGALGATFTLGAVTAGIKGTINQLEELNKVSQKIGVPVEELSALKYAAGLADISLEELSSSMVRLAKNMAGVASGAGGPAAQAFHALGISVKNSDGSLKSQSEVLAEVADQFANYSDSAEKTALSVALFGKAGASMIPLLNQGSKGLRENAKEAARFGVIVDKDLAESAERFNDNLKRLQSSSEGLAISFVSGLLPALNRIAQGMVDAKEEGEGLESMGRLLGSVFETTAFVLKANVVGFTSLGYAIVGVVGAIAELAVGKPTAAMERMNAATKKIDDSVRQFGKTWDEFWGDPDRQGAIDAVTAAWERMDVAQRRAAPGLAENTKAAENFTDSTFLQVEALRKQVEMFGQSEGAIARAKFAIQAKAKEDGLAGQQLETYRIVMAGFGKEIETLTNKLAAMSQKQQFTETIRSLGLQAREVAGEFTGRLAPGFIQAAQSLKLIKEDGSNLNAVLSLSTKEAIELNDALAVLEGRRLTAEFLTPWQQYEEQLKRIDVLLKSSIPISAETAELASLKAAGEMATAYGMAAQSITGPFASAFKDLASMNKKYAGIAKAAAIGEALVQTYLGATKAFTSTIQFGLPVAIAAAAAATAAGLANVAKISATEFAQGGSFKVGGVGGIDSQLISFKATPGEMVDVRTPGQQRGAEGSPVNVTLNGESFSRNQVRDLFDTINSGIRDGYRIKLA